MVPKSVYHGFSVWFKQFVFYDMDIVWVTVDMSTGQPGGPLPSVVRSPGSPRRCLWEVQAQNVSDHGGLGHEAHLSIAECALIESTWVELKNSTA